MTSTQKFPNKEFQDQIDENAAALMKQGKEIFRYDTFGSEDFWDGQLQLHKAILSRDKGGVGEGITARQALQLGLKVDVGQVPELMMEVLKEGSVEHHPRASPGRRCGRTQGLLQQGKTTDLPGSQLRLVPLHG